MGVRRFPQARGAQSACWIITVISHARHGVAGLAVRVANHVGGKGSNDVTPAAPPDDATPGDGDEPAPDPDRLKGVFERQQEEAERTRNAIERESDEAGRRQRQNVRVEVKYPVHIAVPAGDADTRTRDLSATGCGFSTRLPVELEQEGTVTIEFPAWRFTKAFVIRFVKPIIAGYKVGTQFIDLTEEERERLVKEVFDVQREQLRAKRKKPGA